MRTDVARPVRLADYQPPDFAIDEVHLDFALDGERTVVRSRLAMRRTGAADAPLRLDGEGLELLSVRLNGQALSPSAYERDERALTIREAPDAFRLEIETAFSPRANTALSGIYLSQERIFSQCEAEGFRRITYFLDRPDALARYTTRIEADRARFPILLSNGDLVEAGGLPGGRHFAVWRDPFPKPCYLFALVGGAFELIEDRFTTQSGRAVTLRIYVDPGDGERARFAMDALKRAMAWDERAFGREYDLGLFMIVAVRDFNFGAMENKGLNIFNSSLLLADQDTASDADYEAIESVIGHEYFHNWTGNRITCRDWFQLCLKEGLTVFRDQEFSASQRGAALQRIKDVRRLRARQFPEDQGPLAHPVRPRRYVKIDNFYTATVYEKGAELIRMLAALIGPAAFRAGMDLYFARCDGTAATIEDFLACFAEASGQSLAGMLRWYGQAGTPRLTAEAAYDAETGELALTLSQHSPPTPDGSAKAPVPIPVRLGALDGQGRPMALRRPSEPKRAAALERTLALTSARKTWRFVGLAERPALSLLRGFSAPVLLSLDEPPGDRGRRAAHDPDPFNRWEAGRQLMLEALCARAAGAPCAEAGVHDMLRRALARAEAEPGFAALALTPPDAFEIAQSVAIVDPAAIEAARTGFDGALARALETELAEAYDRFRPRGPFSPDPETAGRRALANAALRRLAGLGTPAEANRAQAHLAAADNLTDRLAGLVALDASGSARWEEALAAFHARWKASPLVIDKWFALHARSSRPGAIARVAGLLAHPLYDERTPNRVRAVLASFATGNLGGFHTADGAGYQLLVERCLALDRANPALAARLLGAGFEMWPRLEPGRRALARAALAQVTAAKGASANIIEIAGRALG